MDRRILGVAGITALMGFLLGRWSSSEPLPSGEHRAQAAIRRSLDRDSEVDNRRPQLHAPGEPSRQIPAGPPVLVETDPFAGRFQLGLGEGLPEWPDDLPLELRPDAMREAMAELAESCGYADQVTELECDAPPCMTLVVADEEEDLAGVGAGCGQWADAFGSSESSRTGSALCTDGEVVRYKAFGPMPGELKQAMSVSGAELLRPLNSRTDAMLDAAGCGAPATLRVENRLGHRLEWVPE